MRVRSFATIAVLCLLGAMPRAQAAPGLPVVEGPDVPALSEPVAVVVAFDDERFSCTGSPRTAQVDVPDGGWARVDVEVEITPDGDPWDRLFGVAISGVEVIRGTTPRTAFTVTRDITAYSSVLPPGGTAEVALRLDSYVGAMLGSVRLLFYDEASPAAPDPREAVAVQTWGGLNGAGTALARTLDLGAQAPSSAEIELTTTGHGGEEFWYLNSPEPRIFEVYVDDIPVARFVAMPYVYALLGFGNGYANIPCSQPGTSSFGDAVHPVMWWSGHRAANAAGLHTGNGEIPPYRARVGADLVPLLTGQREVRLVQTTGGATWISSLSLLLTP